jgi:hypothetical protein
MTQIWDKYLQFGRYLTCGSESPISDYLCRSGSPTSALVLCLNFIRGVSHHLSKHRITHELSNDAYGILISELELLCGLFSGIVE